jgi:ribonuclease J
VHNIYVDGQTVGGVTEDSLAQRRTLGEEGMITVVAIIDTDTGRLDDAPDFIAHGFEHDTSTFQPVIPAIEKALAGAAEKNVNDVAELERLIAQQVQMWAQRTYRRRPVVIPVVIEA